MVWHHKERLLAKPQPFGFHGGRSHFKGLSCADLMGQQNISPVKHMSDGIALVRPEFNIGIHADEMDMAAVIFPRPCGIEQFVITVTQPLPTLRLPPDPILKRILDSLLFLLGQCCLFLIQDTLLFTVQIFYCVINPDILQVQRFLQNPVGIGPFCAISGIGRHIVPADRAFPAYLPLCGDRRVTHLDGTEQIEGRLKGFLHKLLDIVRFNPGSAQTNVNLRSVQILWLRLRQRLYIDCKGAVTFGSCLSNPQFLTDIPGKILICSLPARFRLVRRQRIFEDDSP